MVWVRFRFVSEDSGKVPQLFFFHIVGFRKVKGAVVESLPR